LLWLARLENIFATATAPRISAVASVYAGLFPQNFLHFQILVFANFMVDVPPFKNFFSIELTVEAAIMTAATEHRDIHACESTPLSSKSGVAN